MSAFDRKRESWVRNNEFLFMKTVRFDIAVIALAMLCAWNASAKGAASPALTMQLRVTDFEAFSVVNRTRVTEWRNIAAKMARRSKPPVTTCSRFDPTIRPQKELRRMGREVAW